MKAVVFDKYGPPEVLHMVDLEKPIPKDNEILIRIHATAVNSADWRVRKADPFLVRLFFGLFNPRKKIMGFVLSGEIEELGKKVTRYQIGDQVFGSTGMKFGAYAEYVCLPEDAKLITKPPEISHEEAAALPFGGITAFHFLNKAGIKEGQKVLIYGASGATGTAAVQLAKHFGANVKGVTSGANASLVRSIGAVDVIDYQKEKLTDRGQLYDVIFDTVGKTSFSKCKSVLAPGGKYITVNKGLARTSIEGLETLSKLTVDGKFKVVIDRTYPLEQIAEAHRYVEGFHKKGNVVITIIS